MLAVRRGPRHAFRQAPSFVASSIIFAFINATTINDTGNTSAIIALVETTIGTTYQPTTKTLISTTPPAATSTTRPTTTGTSRIGITKTVPTTTSRRSR
jgi:hypothetical protein